MALPGPPGPEKNPKAQNFDFQEKLSKRQAPKVFQKRNMATKRVPRAPILVSTPELAVIFRGESVSDHTGAQGGPTNQNIAPKTFPLQKKHTHNTFIRFVFPLT